MKLKRDPKKLRSAIATVKKAQAEIADGRQKKTALDVEVKTFLETTNMADEDAIHLVAGRRTQAEILGHIIPRKEAALEPLVQALAKEIDDFEASLRAEADAESAALLDKIAGMLRPYCRDFKSQGDHVDGARDAAKRCQVFDAFPSGRPIPSLPSQIEPRNYADVVAVAEAALELHARLEKAGGFAALNFTPEAVS
jgi:hypothetical protein